MNLLKKDKIVKQVSVDVEVKEVKHSFDYRSMLTHTVIFGGVLLLGSVLENFDMINTFIQSHISTTWAVIVASILSTFIKKSIDALVVYLSNKDG